ncbi:CinA family protein [Arthrobacter sp. Sr24]
MDTPGSTLGPSALAALVADAVAKKITVATAESLTAGLVAATIADVPGASAMLQGGIVAYQNSIKEKQLGVSPVLLASTGAVDPEVACSMALGACVALGARLGVSTTGVAGPEPHQGKAVGLVYIGVALDGVAHAREFRFDGDREAIRWQATEAALALVLEVVNDSREQKL